MRDIYFNMSASPKSRLAAAALLAWVLLASAVSPTLIFCQTSDHACVESLLVTCCGPAPAAETGTEPGWQCAESECTDSRLYLDQRLSPPVEAGPPAVAVATTPPRRPVVLAASTRVPLRPATGVGLSTVLLI